MTSKKKIQAQKDVAKVLCLELDDMAKRHGPDHALTKDVLSSIASELKWWEEQATAALKDERISAFEEIFVITDELNAAVQGLEHAKTNGPRLIHNGSDIGSDTRRMIDMIDYPTFPGDTPRRQSPTSNKSNTSSIGDRTRKMIEAMENRSQFDDQKQHHFGFGEDHQDKTKSLKKKRKQRSSMSSLNQSSQSLSTHPAVPSNSLSGSLRETKSISSIVAASNEGNLERSPISKPKCLELFISSLEGLPTQDMEGRLYVSISLAYNSPTTGPFGEAVATNMVMLDKTSGRAVWDQLFEIPYPTDMAAQSLISDKHHIFVCFNVLCPVLSTPTPLLLASGSLPLFPPADGNRFSIVDHPMQLKLHPSSTAATNAFGPSSDSLKNAKMILYFQLPHEYYKLPRTEIRMQEQPQPQQSYNPLATSEQINTRQQHVRGFNSVFQSPSHRQYLENRLTARPISHTFSQHNGTMPISPNNYSTAPRPTTSTAHELYPMASPMQRVLHPPTVGGTFALPDMPYGTELPVGMEDTPTIRALVILNDNMSQDLNAYKLQLEQQTQEIAEMKRKLHFKQNQVAICSNQQSELDTAQRELADLQNVKQQLEFEIREANSKIDTTTRQLKALEGEVETSRHVIKRHEFNLQESRIDLLNEKRKVQQIVKDLQTSQSSKSSKNDSDLCSSSMHRPRVCLTIDENDVHISEVNYPKKTANPLSEQFEHRTKQAALNHLKHHKVPSNGINSAWGPRVNARHIGTPDVSTTAVRGGEPTDSIRNAMNLLDEIDGIDQWLLKSGSTPMLKDRSLNIQSTPSPHQTIAPLRNLGYCVPNHQEAECLKMHPPMACISSNYSKDIKSSSLSHRSGVVFSSDDVNVTLLEPEDSESHHDHLDVCYATTIVELSCDFETEYSDAGAYLRLQRLDINSSLGMPEPPASTPNRVIYEISCHCLPNLIIPGNGFPVVIIAMRMSDGSTTIEKVKIPVTRLMFTSSPINGMTETGRTTWQDISQLSNDNLMRRILGEMIHIRGTSCPTYPDLVKSSNNVASKSLLYSAGLFCCLATQTDDAYDYKANGLSKACAFSSTRVISRGFSVFFQRGTTSSGWRVLMIGCNSSLAKCDRNLDTLIDTSLGNFHIIELYEQIGQSRAGVTLVAANSVLLSEINDTLFALLKESGYKSSTAPSEDKLENIGTRINQSFATNVDYSTARSPPQSRGIRDTIGMSDSGSKSYWLRHEM